MSEFDMPARIKRLRLPPGRRIIAVSDIHETCRISKVY